MTRLKSDYRALVSSSTTSTANTQKTDTWETHRQTAITRWTALLLSESMSHLKPGPAHRLYITFSRRFYPKQHTNEDNRSNQDQQKNNAMKVAVISLTVSLDSHREKTTGTSGALTIWLCCSWNKLLVHLAGGELPEFNKEMPLAQKCSCFDIVRLLWHNLHNKERWLVGWVDGWMGGWMDGWVDG